MEEGIFLAETILEATDLEDLDKLSDKYLVLQVSKEKHAVKEPCPENIQPVLPPDSPSQLRAEREPTEAIRYTKLPQASVKVNLMEVHVTTKSFC